MRALQEPLSEVFLGHVGKQALRLTSYVAHCGSQGIRRAQPVPGSWPAAAWDPREPYFLCTTISCKSSIITSEWQINKFGKYIQHITLVLSFPDMEGWEAT